MAQIGVLPEALECRTDAVAFPAHFSLGRIMVERLQDQGLTHNALHPGIPVGAVAVVCPNIHLASKRKTDQYAVRSVETFCTAYLGPKGVSGWFAVY